MLSEVWQRASSETGAPDCAWSGWRAPRIFPRMVHVGIGYDVHQLVAGRKLVLGGVEIPHDKGLDGHSDADVLMHAVCDAVLGALGAGDIGQFFPNTDPRWKGVPSRIFLEEAARQVKFRNGRIVNVDASLIAQAPKVMPHATKMKQHIAEALGVPVNKIGIKATTNEQMGFIGRGEGIAAMAVASVELPEGA
jgi:2-C-methyl-D-erythritol 2,4-cyclodiphosphate synthase